VELKDESLLKVEKLLSPEDEELEVDPEELETEGN
jgi:hypothetical protein